MTCGIYKITNSINGKIYIGQSVNIEKRKQCHKGAYNNSCISKAIRKYGFDNFKYEIVVVCPKQYLNMFETLYIKQLNTVVPSGYNVQLGGALNSTGVICTEETKQKISKTKKGQGLGIKRPEHSKWCIENNSNAKSVMYNGQIFKSFKELSTFLGISPPGIRYRMRNNLIKVTYV